MLWGMILTTRDWSRETWRKFQNIWNLLEFKNVLNWNTFSIFFTVWYPQHVTFSKLFKYFQWLLFYMQSAFLSICPIFYFNLRNRWIRTRVRRTTSMNPKEHGLVWVPKCPIHPFEAGIKYFYSNENQWIPMNFGISGI